MLCTVNTTVVLTTFSWQCKGLLFTNITAPVPCNYHRGYNWLIQWQRILVIVDWNTYSCQGKRIEVVSTALYVHANFPVTKTPSLPSVRAMRCYVRWILYRGSDHLLVAVQWVWNGLAQRVWANTHEYLCIIVKTTILPAQCNELYWIIIFHKIWWP